MQRGKWLAGVLAGVLLLVTGVSASGAPASGAGAAGGQEQVQLLLNGKVVGSFSDVSGLTMEVALEDAVCRVGGVDDDCDDTSTEVWEAAVRTALWQLVAAADEAGQNTWLSSRASHDVALNAIRNLKGLAARVEETLNDPTLSLKTKHDTVKNSIGNIRACVRVFGDTTGGEAGVYQAVLKAMNMAAAALQDQVAQTAVRYRPGRPVFGNITFEGPLGGSDRALLEWFTKVRSGTTDRKSGSIIYLDRDGKEVMRYNFFEAWPVRYEAGHGVERIELAVEKVERATP
jgi:hypothetical protein